MPKKYIISTIYTIIAAVIYCFWAFPYRAALSYREQMQLFQTTGSYLADMAGHPAGLSVYIGEFLTQTFNNFWIGAAVMTLLIILFMLSCRVIIKSFFPEMKPTSALLISMVPLTALWLYLGIVDVTLGFIVALILTLGAVWLFMSVFPDSTVSGRYLHMLALTAFLYWLAGPIAVVFTLLIIFDAGRSSSLSLPNKILFCTLSLLWLAANFFMWIPSLPYPVSYQLIGIGFLIKPDVLEVGQIVVEAICVLLPVLALIAQHVPQKVMTPAVAGFIVAVAVVCYPHCYDSATYRLLDYDYMVRANDWDGILKYSDKHNPDLPLSVSATNLAMGMTGQLDARAFDYFQNGQEGLIPSFSKEPISSWTTGEIFFQLGMVNTAQRFYFEGMEAIPNYSKSARAVRRLAETSIIRGDYRLAEKYLHMLENTTFYRKLARRNLKLIKDPQAVASHPLYGTLRSRMVDEDYLFSEGEVDKTLGQLYLKDSSNTLAKQYLMLYPLLQRDLNKFGQYMGVIAESEPHYNPLLAQQAAAFMAMKSGQPIPQGLVSPAVEQALRGFAQAWTSGNPDLIAQHRHTLYHYLISNE